MNDELPRFPDVPDDLSDDCYVAGCQEKRLRSYFGCRSHIFRLSQRQWLPTAEQSARAHLADEPVLGGLEPRGDRARVEFYRERYAISTPPYDCERCGHPHRLSVDVYFPCPHPDCKGYGVGGNCWITVPDG